MSAGHGRTHAGGWTKVDDSAIEHIGEIGRSAYCVYSVLLQHADRDGKCWPSEERIGEMTGLSDRTVRRLIGRLANLGLVTKDRVHGGRGTGSRNCYVVDFRPDTSVLSKSELDRTPVTNAPDTSGQKAGRDYLLNKTQRIRPRESPRSKDSNVLDKITYPEGMDTSEVRAAIVEWLAYKRGRKQTYKQPATQMGRLLNQDRFRGDPAIFVAAVDHSISSNYAGCYPPGGNSNGRKGTGTSSQRGGSGGDMGSGGDARSYEREGYWDAFNS